MQKTFQTNDKDLEKEKHIKFLLSQKGQWSKWKHPQKNFPQAILPREIERKIQQGDFWVYREQLKNFEQIKKQLPWGGFIRLSGGGLALFDAENPIALRTLDMQNRNSDPKPYVKKALLRALQIRLDFFPILKKQNFDKLAKENPKENQTNFAVTAMRLLHGENDFLSGLTADYYQGVLVYRPDSSAWLPFLNDINVMLKEVLSIEASYITSRYGKTWLDDDLPQDKVFYFRENNLRFELDVESGQKTGFFLDMRDNRQWIQNIAKGKKILNGFSYTCAFSVYALQAQAHMITNVDISLPALQAGERNHKLNHLPQKHQQVEFMQADFLHWLQNIPVAKKNQKGNFDIIILDPPSFVHSQEQVDKALRSYFALNNEALLRLGSGQYLATASCSARVDYQQFLATIHAAADSARKRIRLVYQNSGGSDHPYVPNRIFQPYLKFLVFYVE